MSIYALVAGSLINDPQQRRGTKAAFTTVTIRADGDEFVSIIAFGPEADRLLEYSKGDAVAVAGRARVGSRTGRDGIERHGLNVVVEQFASVKPRAMRRVRPYPKPRAARPRHRDEGSALPSDTVDDLFVGGAE
jgi:single-stranded DNA-binding protein